jgi:hypothetical protein
LSADVRGKAAGQLSLFVGGAPPPPGSGMPAAVADVLSAARSLSFTTRIVRGCWGVSVGPKRRWVLAGDRCCALSAYLVVNEATAGDRDGRSPMTTVARLLGVTQGDWYRYGAAVARELKPV